MKKLVRLAAAGVTAAAMSLFGLSSLVSASSISLTGPGSNNVITSTSTSTFTNLNNNNVSVNNINTQFGQSGRAVVRGNTFGGSAFTGSVTNSNTFGSNVSVINTSFLPTGSCSVSGSIFMTGPGSNNVISTSCLQTLVLTNNNNISVNNLNTQTGLSGNAFVRGNTFGGGAFTGNVSNYNSGSTSVYVSN